MSKKALLAASLTLFSTALLAAPPSGTVGIGVAHTESTLDSGNTIFMPIQFDNGLWAEPFLAYQTLEDDAGNDITALSVGAGLFKDFHRAAQTRAYVGGRLGYQYLDIDPAGAGNSDDESGILVQPVIGFGYEPVDNVMFGAEAFVSYQDSDIDGIESYGTGTSLFARYFFSN